MKHKRTYAIIGWSMILFLMTDLHAQVEMTRRLEIPLEDQERAFNILHLGDRGIMIYRRQQDALHDDLVNWEIRFYDRSMELRRSIVVEVEYYLEVMAQAYKDDKAYLLFSGIRNLRKRHALYQINIPSMRARPLPIRAFLPETITYFSIFNKTLVLGGKEKGKPSIVFFDPEQGTSVALQGLYERNMVIFDASVDEENGIFTAVSRFRNNARQSAISIRSYDESGAPIENIRLEPREGMDYIYARAFIANHNLRIVAGTYSDASSSLPAGFFLSSVSLSGETKTVYYPVNELRKRLDSLQSIDKHETGERQVTGENGSRERHHWYITELTEYKRENLMLAESFKMEKSNASFSGGDGEVYYYQQALVMAFSDDLDLQWVNGMDLSATCSPDIEKILDMETYADSIKLYFFDNKSLVEKVILENRSRPSRLMPPIVTNNMVYEDLVECASRLYHFRHWYGDHFLFSGLRPDPDDPQKDIFFIYKMHYP